MSDADPYAVLGVAPDASPEEVKRAWRRLARDWHPDRNPAPEAAERFKELAAAWATLSDPAARARHDRRTRRVRHGDLPEEFLLDVADAVERAEAWIVGSVLPHYVRHARGLGVEAAARLWADLDALATPHVLEPAPRAAARVQRWLGRIDVTLITEPAPHPTVLLRHDKGWEIAVTPAVLWHAGIRSSAALDDLLLRALLMRYAQIAAHGRYVPADGPDAVEAARRRDDAAVWRVRLRWGGWTLVAILIVVMLVAGAQGW